MKILKQYKNIILQWGQDGYTVRVGRNKTVTNSIIVALETYCKLVLKDIDNKKK